MNTHSREDNECGVVPGSENFNEPSKVWKENGLSVGPKQNRL